VRHPSNYAPRDVRRPAHAHAESLANPRAFWARAAEDIEWVRRPRAVWNDSDPLRPSWFPGAMLNTCYNAVDLHV
jgi:propionyl-CoA synthetase